MAVIPTAILTDRFTRALDFATVVHASQVRKGTRIPYVAHLLGVASLAIEHGADEETAIAALLHDAAEDQGGHTMLEQVRARFGERVAQIVKECTDTFDDPKPKWQPRKEEYIRHVLTEAKIESCLVSAADKLHNARAILHDLRATSDHGAFWSRFSQSPERTGWYYGSLERALSSRLATEDGREMVEELHYALDAITGLPGCNAFGAGVSAGHAGRACPDKSVSTDVAPV